MFFIAENHFRNWLLESVLNKQIGLKHELVSAQINCLLVSNLFRKSAFNISFIKRMAFASLLLSWGSLYLFSSSSSFYLRLADLDGSWRSRSRSRSPDMNDELTNLIWDCRQTCFDRCCGRTCLDWRERGAARVWSSGVQVGSEGPQGWQHNEWSCWNMRY